MNLKCRKRRNILENKIDFPDFQEWQEEPYFEYYGVATDKYGYTISYCNDEDIKQIITLITKNNSKDFLKERLFNYSELGYKEAIKFLKDNIFMNEIEKEL